MRAITRQRLLRTANEASTSARVRVIAAELFKQHDLMNQALEKGDVSLLSRAIHASRKAIKQLRYVLRMEEQ